MVRLLPSNGLDYYMYLPTSLASQPAVHVVGVVVGKVVVKEEYDKTGI